MELTKQQINQISIFVDGKSVKFVDVKFEIVDHLANLIEDEISEKRIAFDQAFQNTIEIYDDSGFKYLVKYKSKILINRWRKEFWSSVMSFLKLPRLLVVIGIFFLVEYFSNTWDVSPFQKENFLMLSYSASIFLITIMSKMYSHYLTMITYKKYCFWPLTMVGFFGAAVLGPLVSKISFIDLNYEIFLNSLLTTYFIFAFILYIDIPKRLIYSQIRWMETNRHS